MPVSDADCKYFTSNVLLRYHYVRNLEMFYYIITILVMFYDASEAVYYCYVTNVLLCQRQCYYYVSNILSSQRRRMLLLR